MKKTLATLLIPVLLAGAATAADKLFSVNLYAYGRNLATEWQQESWRETVRIDPTDADQSAGFWDTTAWQNVLATANTATITADDGATTATFTRLSSRNAAPWNWTTFRDDTDSTDVGNATLLDGHGNGTSLATEPFPGYSYRFQVTNIPFPLYDVIVYFGANSGQYLGGGARIRVNGEIPADPLDKTGGTNFVLPAGEPTGTLDEITTEGDGGNYIVYTLQTGSTFDAQVFGTSNNGFAHIGPAGFQIRENLTVAGPVDGATSTVVALPTAVPADGSSASTVTVTLTDASGVPVSGKNVALSGSTGNATISPSTAQPSGTDGKVSFTVKSLTPGTEVFTATDVSDSITLQQTASVDFSPLIPDASLSTVVASPPGAYADGSSTSTITVTVKNADGLPLAGINVTLADDPATADISPPGAQATDSNGQVTVSVSSSSVGAVAFTATADSVVIGQTATVEFVDPSVPLAFNVNLYASSGAIDTWVPQDPATLVGPGGGLGESWNQFNTQTGSGLLSSSGVVSGVGFTNNVPSGWRASTTGLSMLMASRAHFGKGADTTHTITGLTPGSYFHLYVASYNQNTSLDERALGEWSTPNPTTTMGPQMIDARAGLNQTTWEQGLNYVLFEYVEVDANGQIILNGDAADIGDYGGEATAKRLHLNGFQLVPTAAPSAMITSFGIPGSAGVIDQEAKTISLVVPAGTNLATFAPFFTLASGTANQTSGAPPSPTFAAQNPVDYVVTDTSTVPDTVNTYQVTVTVAPGIGTLVIDLGAGTTIVGGTYGSHGTNLPLPALPAGSILRSIAVDTLLTATDNENFASDLSVLLDPTPQTPGEDFAVEITSGLLPLGGAGALKLGWPSSAASTPPPAVPLVDTKTDADWTAAGAIDLSTFGLFLGNAYDHDAGITGDGGTWSGTITLTYDIAGAASAYSTWSGGQAFASDKNGDGVSNGLAFLLGAADADENALGRLPEVSEQAGGLVLTFSILNAANRGPAVATVQWSNDLGTSDPWATAPVPETSGTVGGVSFVVTPNGNLNDVVATIPAGEAAGGMLFGRVSGTEN